MISNPGPATKADRPTTPGARRPTTSWIAHLALILAAAAAAGILASRGNGSVLRESSIGILIVIVLLFAAQIMIARRAGGALGNGTAYALCAAGAVCMLVGQFAAARPLLMALTILSVLFFVSGIVAFVLQIRQLNGSQ